MADRRPKLPRKITQGKIGKSQEARVPSATGGGGGKISTNFQNINWTPTKLIIILSVLVIPYLIAIIFSLRAGYYLIVGILVSLAILIGLLYLALRFVDKGDF